MTLNLAGSIEFKNISKKYSKNDVLKDARGEFLPGRVHLVIGKNGSGKSTLMRILAGAEAPDAGSVSVENRDLFTDRTHVLGNSFLVNEAFEIHLKKRIASLTEVFGAFYPHWQNNIYKEWLEKFKLEPNAYFTRLSRGQKMQVAFALAMGSGAKNLFIDEITSVLDAHARYYVLSKLDELAEKNFNILMTTNLVLELRSLSNANVWIMNNKKVELLPQENLESFVKIRAKKKKHLATKIWCVPIGTGSVDEVLYISKKEELLKLDKDDYEIDRRENTVEDYFLYHSALIGEDHEEVA